MSVDYPDREKVSIIQGSDGLNYDEELEYLFQVLSKNDLRNRETILHNLKVYTEKFVAPNCIPEFDLAVLDDAGKAVEFASSLGGVQIWKLDDHQRQHHSNNPAHEWGARLYNNDDPVTAFDVKTAALLAVVQCYREFVHPYLNPQRPPTARLH